MKLLLPYLTSAKDPSGVLANIPFLSQSSCYGPRLRASWGIYLWCVRGAADSLLWKQAGPCGHFPAGMRVLPRTPSLVFCELHHLLLNTPRDSGCQSKAHPPSAHAPAARAHLAPPGPRSCSGKAHSVLLKQPTRSEFTISYICLWFVPR